MFLITFTQKALDFSTASDCRKVVWNERRGDLVEEGAEDHFEFVRNVSIGHLKIVLNVVSCQIPADLFNTNSLINTSRPI
jgi:hypothetical protein